MTARYRRRTTALNREGAALRTALTEWFGIRAAEADVLMILYRAAGDLVTGAEIAARTATSTGTIRFSVCELRRSMEVGSIDTVPTEGYRLTDCGMDECKGAIRSMGEELRRAG